jgi:hypothetical protein
MSTYPSNLKARFERWFDCSICGIPWPESMLKKQRGKLVCPEDIDGKSHADYMREGSPPGEEPRESPWTSDGDDK